MCIRVTNAIICFGGPVYTIRVGRKDYRFEMHKWCGPVLLKKDDDPYKEQFKGKGQFWDAVSRWAQQGKRHKDGVCIYD